MKTVLTSVTPYRYRKVRNIRERTAPGRAPRIPLPVLWLRDCSVNYPVGYRPFERPHFQPAPIGKLCAWPQTTEVVSVLPLSEDLASSQHGFFEEADLKFLPSDDLSCHRHPQHDGHAHI